MIIAMLAACLALPAYPVTIGEGNELNRRPLDFYYKNSLNETLYYPDEIGFTGMINAISLHCSFVTDLPGMPVKIWMGSTILPDLSGGWIPSTQLVPVFDGVVDFPSGEHEIFIPLQNHFEYQGQNLVVMFNRPMDTSYYSSSNRFFGQTGTIPRALNIYHDRTLFDPANPPATTASASFAQTTFHMTITEVSPDPTLIYPQSVNFGTVFLNTTQYRQIWVSNTGEGSLALNSISLEGSPCFSLQDLPDLPQSLSLWEWLSFQVNYNPTSYGDHSATISILDDTGRALHSIPISGCAPDLEVAYPNGGETWLSGTTETIRWPSFPTEVDIFLSYDAGTNWTALATTDGLSGFYNMTVPALNSSQFKVKLVSTSLPDDYYDESDGTFTISTNPTLPRVIMTHPSNPNLHFEVGEPLNITWTRSNLTSVSLDLSTDDGLSWQEIVSGLDADSYPWTVPYTPGLNFRIRVRSVTNPAVADFSDNAFSISRIQLLSPLGGELLTSDYSNGYTIPITWIAPGMATVNCEYSPDGGTSWISIGSFVAGSGMSNWYLPGVPSDNYLVRISNAANPSINSVSGTFNLRNPLRITHPQVGGFATNGSLINIRWINQDVAPGTSVWWEYSLDNSSWTRINANANPVDS
ncbi:MAG: choice-of-anchor D domain-containing protein [Candidatus Cloacimonetes bacterium]|nr:choice-of-anchor D domain-containing protein [Candidatus Cloacimonadota bacterium]